MGYLPGLDGIRALAVIGVLLYHADIGWLSGGFLGVDVFFVLSGFLITSLILEEFDRSGRVDFRRFYLGRARRLLPALGLMIVVVGIAVAVFYRDSARTFLNDAIASAFYVNNWWYVFADQSYFAFIGRPPLLKHLWSLSVEEQFYLVWPAIVFLVVRRWRRRAVLVTALFLATASTAVMIVISTTSGFPEYADPSRAYFGTDAHAMGLLIGAALACLWRPGRLRTDITSGGRTIITTIGFLALGTVLAFFVFAQEFSPFLYQGGGFTLLACAVAVLIAAASHPAVTFGSSLGTQPMRYLGQRSYGLYLWHWPVFMVTRPGLDIALDGTALLSLRLAITVVIAELSFRFVEMPIRRGAIARWLAKRRSTTGNARRMSNATAVLVAVGSVAVVTAVIAGLASAPRTDTAGGVAPDVAAAIGIADGGPSEVTLDDQVTPSTSSGPLGGATPSGEPLVPAPSGRSTGEPPPVRDNGPVTLFGDSVMLGARKAVQQSMPGARVDAAVSRMPGAFVGPLKRAHAKGRLAPIVVIHPATNGVLPEAMLREMLTMLSDVPNVVVVNARAPRVWQDPNNTVIAKVVPDFPNAVVADWNSASRGHREYFVSDGIHLTAAGGRAFAELIRSAAGL